MSTITGVKFIQSNMPNLRTVFTKDVIAQSVLSTALSTMAVKILGCGHTSTNHQLNREG